MIHGTKVEKTARFAVPSRFTLTHPLHGDFFGVALFFAVDCPHLGPAMCLSERIVIVVVETLPIVLIVGVKRKDAVRCARNDIGVGFPDTMFLQSPDSCVPSNGSAAFGEKAFQLQPKAQQTVEGEEG